MFSSDQYRLLDFGAGRRLEQFGAHLLDRPCPAAEGVPKAHAELWSEATARFLRKEGQEGIWKPVKPIKQPWPIQHATWQLQLRPTQCGHLGVFPEQATNWDWIEKQVRRANRPLKVLNLFAYTGGSTLAAAAAGAEVVHVDAAQSTVNWARENAKLSGLEDAPIRWIAEDALKFVRREIRRGNQYDAVILDPPSYGHGPNGKPWKINEHLSALLEGCGEVTKQSRAFLLLTCHSPGFGPAELEAYLADAVFGSCQAGATARELSLSSEDGRALPAGVAVRWPR